MICASVPQPGWDYRQRLPAATRTWYNHSPNDSLVYLIDMDDRAARMSPWWPDPLARRTFDFPRDEVIPGDEDWEASMIELPLRFYLDVGTFENGFRDPSEHAGR